ncbi:putative lipid II flippase FtsW [Streptomyces sp. NPDC006393]|uniref:putative lipid II flippase FtsW n=1 Tax=Streptomyces sp. NPDC006393 TaxID=3156763 RepID=UPI00340C763F
MAASPGSRTGRPPVRRTGARPAAGRGAPDNPVRRLVTRARKAWDRPLTAYYVILGGSSLITVLGLVMVYSASQITALQMALPGSYFFRKQLLAAAIGGGLLLAAARMPVKLHRALAYPILAGAVFLMALVQVPGIGMSVNGNQNWIALGGSFQIQPSEIGKLALVLWGADLIARKQEKRLLTQWKHMLVPLVPVAFMLLGLIMLGGDMGTAIILTAILFGLLWLAGAPTRLFVGVLSVAALIGLVLIKTSPNRLDRFACVGSGDVTKCWQAVHGIYALASGGLFGSGLGASVEKWGQLPEAHTDFIFAVTGEELGLAGTLSVLALFAALGYAGIRVAGRTEDPFVRYAAGGVTTWITAQAVINIGAVLGLLPIAGVPLPLFSYGGSALLPTMFAIGLLIAFARDEPAARAALAMRQPRFGRKRAGGSAAGRKSGRKPDRSAGRKPGRGSGREPGGGSGRGSGRVSGAGSGQGSGQGPRRWNTMRRRASAARPSGER